MSIAVGTKTPLSKNNRSYSSSKNIAKRSAWFYTAVVIAAIIFVLINILPALFGLFMEVDKQRQDASVSLTKLKHFVQTCSYEREQYGPWPWWVARAYFLTAAPNIVAMGDSQLNAAFIQADAIAAHASKDCVTDRSCVALRKSLHAVNPGLYPDNLHCVNLALGGAMPSDYYLMSKAFFTKENHPKTVILAVSPRSFVDDTLVLPALQKLFNS